MRFQSLHPGNLFAGRYRILSVLGSGGTGEVFEVFDEVAQDRVALKVLFPGTTIDEASRLQRELRLVRQLVHPGILRMFDIGSSEGLSFIVSELLEGESLHDALAAQAPFPPERAARVLKAILSALAHAHREGVIHRDIKPANIFLVPDPAGERVVLLDFGLAREMNGPGLTTVGRFLGTPRYCAPEQIRGEEGIGPASDLYSTGVVAWEMISGKPPFVADSEIDVLHAQLNSPLPDPDRQLRRAGVVMRLVVETLLHKSPADRPSSAEQALLLLEQGAQGAKLRLVARRLYERLASWRFAIAGLFVLLLLVLAAHYPTHVVHDGRQVTWKSWAGLDVNSAQLPRQVVSTSFVQGRFGLPGVTWVLTEPPESIALEDGRITDPTVSLIWRTESPFSAPQPLFSDLARLFLKSVYPGIEGHFEPKQIYTFDDTADGGGNSLFYAVHCPGYPSFLTLLNKDGQVGTFHNPGHLSEDFSIMRPDPEGGLLVLAHGANNLLGPRAVILALPVDQRSSGQAPPYTAPIRIYPPAGGWYYFLSGFEEARRIQLSVNGGEILVRRSSGERIRLDAATGVPLDERHRGGLTREQWQSARDDLLSRLLEAAGVSEIGDHLRAAQILEEYARNTTASAELLSIARYQAAVHQLRNSNQIEDMSAALENVREANRLEAGLPRYYLLEAELLARLGRRDDVMQALKEREGRRQMPFLLYEWYLVDWLAGMPVPVDHFSTLWSGQIDGGRVGWGGLLNQVDAWRRGDYDRAESHNTLPKLESRAWQLHYYWATRAALDRPDRDPVRALALATRARRAATEGTWSPTLSIWLHARALTEAATLTQEDLEAALEELAQAERRAGSDLSALAVLGPLRQDVAVIAETLGREELAARLRSHPPIFPTLDTPADRSAK